MVCKEIEIAYVMKSGKQIVSQGETISHEMAK